MPGGFHGAASDAEDAARSPSGECQPHPRDGFRREARHLPRHSCGVDCIWSLLTLSASGLILRIIIRIGLELRTVSET